MPELPEVETIRRILVPIVKGKTIDKIEVFYPKAILSGSRAFASSLVHEQFLDVTRKGKYLLFHLTHDKVVISHLRMEGKYYESSATEQPHRHDILRYDFTDGSALRLNDVRKFGILILSGEATFQKIPCLAKLGEEPWDLSAKDLYSRLHKRKRLCIKEALLDQHILSGIGNIYDDEILFAAKINPKKLSGSLTLKECETLLSEADRILKEAVERGGSTIRSYHPKEGISGTMQNRLLAYGKGNTPCPRCGFPLRKIKIGGRGTVYCPNCQKLPGKPLIIGVTGPIASGKSAVCRYLAERGYDIIDADQIVSELYHEKSVLSFLGRLFGASAIADGHFNRAVALALLQDDPKKKKALEQHIHPLVFKRIRSLIAASKSERIALDVPLLFNSPLEESCDLIISVFADAKIQAARLRARGKDPEESLRLNENWPRGKAKKTSGLVLDGSGSLESLEAQLKRCAYL